jgi:hypothetical protein
MSNIALPNPAQQSDINAAVLQAIGAVPLSAPTVTVTPLVPASTTYTYTVVTKVNGEVTPGSATSTTGAVSLTSTTPNVLGWSPAFAGLAANGQPAAAYDVYRTVGGATQGKIASNLSSTSLIDGGLVGDGTTPPSFNTSGTTAIGVVEPVQNAVANGAISIVTGKVFITKGSAAALTLPLPIAGPPSSGGQDGAVLSIISTTAFAHTVTTPANGINGADDTATFAASVPAAFSLTAFNGKWWSGALTSVTLSEV